MLVLAFIGLLKMVSRNFHMIILVDRVLPGFIVNGISIRGLTPLYISDKARSLVEK